jgi:hypothetical protein
LSLLVKVMFGVTFTFFQSVSKSLLKVLTFYS